MQRALGVAICVASLGLVVSATAHANWTHKGKGELKENASVTLSGELTLFTSAGNVSCPTTIGATLTASGSSGHVNSFTVSKPSECDLTGSLAAICGTHGVTKVERTGTWALTAEETDIAISAIDVHYAMAGCLIPSFRLKGSATASLDKAAAIGSATLSGTQTLYNALGEESGSAELKGTLSVSPAGTYGVKTGSTVETVWTDGDSHLSEDGKLTLAGAFSFSGSGGSVSCPATVKLLLESSTVEEEEAEGEIESFTVAKASECDLGGGYKTTCGTNAVAKVQQTGTATLRASEEDIAVSGLVLDYEFEKCAITELKVEGSPTIAVTSPEAIEEASFSAGSLEVFNSKGETVGTASAGGSASASPSGTFQLVEVDLDEGEGLSLSDEWHTHGEEGKVTITESEPDEVKFSGKMSLSSGSVRLGPCIVHAEALIWNDPGEETGTGQINSFSYTTPCDVKIGSTTLPTAVCQLSAISANTEEPWHINLGAETSVDIEGWNFTTFYSEGCQKSFGFPAEAGTSGTATGHAENREPEEGKHEVCIVIENEGDFSGGVVFDGELCAPA
jgi:hypothetical protein